MAGCIHDSFSPCEHSGKCYKPKYRETVDEINNEVYHEVSNDGGHTWYDAEE